MKKLDWYLAKKFLGSVAFMLLVTAIVTIVFDVSEKVDDFTESRATFMQIVFGYYVNFIPTIIDLISPIMIFLSALYFTSRIANNSEIVAMLSAGISYRRIIRPYIIVAVLLCLTDMSMKNFVFPKAYNNVLEFERLYINGSGYTYAPINVHRRLSPNEFFYCYMAKYNEKRVTLFSYERYNGQDLVYKLRAPDAFYDSTHKDWIIRDYTVREINGMHELIKTGDSLHMKLPITIEEFGEKVKSIPSMTTPELSKQIQIEKLKGSSDVPFLEVERWRRFFTPLDIIVLVLIAVSLATRKVRGGLGAHLLFGILVAISHEMFVRFTTTFSTNGDLPAVLGVGLPTIIYGTVAAILLKRAQK